MSALANDRQLEEVTREPISAIDRNTETTKLESGIALCLSGGERNQCTPGTDLACILAMWARDFAQYD